MIQGHMDLQRFDARGLTREEIDAGIQAMGLDRFLKEVHKNGHWSGKNRILTALARCMYYGRGHSTDNGGWLNAPNPGNYYNDSISPGMSHLVLASTSTEPAVTEAYTNRSYYVNFPDIIGPSKRVDTDCPVDVEVFKDTTGKESVILRQKAIWYPGESTSSEIRSIVLYGAEADLSMPRDYLAKTRMARWRIKDSGGVPVTLTKLDQEILLLQYSFIMYSR